MTQNQINYWRLQEDRRSHLAQEGETNRSNLAKEAENYRSNLARETETHRSNTVNEGIAFGNLTESQRSHMAQEDISNRNLEELVRHQMVTEAETNRANLAKELENYRHNSAVEAETYRSNLVYEGIQGAALTEKTIYDQQLLSARNRELREQQRANDLKYRTDMKAAENAGTQQIVYVNNPRFRGEYGGVGTNDQASNVKQLVDTFGRYIMKGADFLLPGD